MNTTDAKTIFHGQVSQLIAAAIITELSVTAAIMTMCPPSEDTWRTYFAFRRSILPALAAVGVAIGGCHVFHAAKKPFGWLLATLVVDTFGVVAAAHVALAIAMQASLSIAFTSRWNTPIRFLGGIKPFQVVDIVLVVVVTLAVILLLAALVEWVASSVWRLQNRQACGKQDAVRQETVICNLTHRFSAEGAVRHLKAQIKAAMRSVCGASARCNICWHDADNTVEVVALAVGDGGSRVNQHLALALASELARIDAKYAADRADGEKMFSR